MIPWPIFDTPKSDIIRSSRAN